MVDVTEIEDRDSLEAWLNARPEATRQQDAVTIAHRAAMRVLPLYLAWQSTRSPQDDLTALPVLRVSLISGVATLASTPEIRNADAFAAAADAFAARADAFAAAADAFAARAAAFAAAAAAARAAAAAAAARADAAADAAAFAARADADIVWQEIQHDAGRLQAGDSPMQAPLWHDPENNPLAQAWDDTVKSWTAADTDWSFWIRWYDSALNPTRHGAQNGPMLTEIATQDDAFWEGSDAEVNERIAAIVQRHAIPASENAETIQRDPDSGQFQAIAVNDLPSRVMADALERIHDVVEQMRDAGKTSNAYTALSFELDLIQRNLIKYDGNPLRLYETFIKVVRRIDAKESEGLCPPGDLLIGDLRNDLDSSAIDIMGNSDAVARTIRMRVGTRFNRLSIDERQRLHELSKAAASESDEELAQEVIDDDIATDDEALPAEERDESRYRLGSRLLRMDRIKRQEVVRAAEDTAKIGKGVGAAWDFIGWVASWFV